MGTSLSGLTPANTYQSLIKVGDNSALSATLKALSDGAGNDSPLKLSTTAVQIVSPLRISTDDPSDMYLDCEDGSQNNRFNITRNISSQQVNLNFASNPAGSTTIVGAVRTYKDGVNLSEVMTFREDGNVGMGIPNAITNLQVKGTILAGDGTGATYSSLGNAQGNYGSVGSNYYTSGGSYLRTYNDSVSQLYFNGGGFQFRNAPGGAANSSIGFNTQMEIGVGAYGYLTLGTNVSGSISGAKLGVRGDGSTSATTSLLVQNSGGTETFKVQDDGNVVVPVKLSAANNKFEVTSSGNQLIIKNPATGNFFYIGPSNVCGVDAAFTAPTLTGGSLTIQTASGSFQGSNMSLSSFLASNTGTNYGLQIKSQYANMGAGGPNYGKQVRFYDNLVNSAIQMDMTFAYVNPIINYTSTGNGQIVGFDFDPVVTSVTANTKVRAFQSSVGGAYINTTTYQASAILQSDSTTQGFLPPRMTTTQRDAIATPATGLKVYSTTTNTTDTYDGATWQRFGQQTLIKGSGNTAATTSLKVQNAGGVDVLKVTDDMYVTIQNTNSTECFQLLGFNSDASIKFTPSGGNSRIVLKSQSSGLILGTVANDWADVLTTSGAQTLRIGTLTPAGGGVNYYASQNGAAGYHKWFLNGVQNAQLTGAQYVLDDSGTVTRDASSILQANSTSKGFLSPRMTNAQRLAIASPAIGLEVYCTDAVEGKYIYKSTGWTFVA